MMCSRQRSSTAHSVTWQLSAYEKGVLKHKWRGHADVLTAVQEGEFEVVQEVIGGRIVPVNAVDQSGCSLLHWAAINNRVVIARLLIENGLTKSSPGGVLGETPLQWALRKKYYLMMEVIFKQTQCDLSVKSVQGNDALHLACKLGMSTCE
jgi:palmitoyltransferase